MTGREYTPGRATIDPAGVYGTHPAGDPNPDDPLSWGTYGLTEWLAHTWSVAVDERLDTMVSNVYDLGERMAHLTRVVIVALCTLVLMVAALLAAVLWGR